MERAAEPSGDDDATGEVPARVVCAEDELWRVAAATRVVSGDLILSALHATRVLRRLREMSPELVAAAEHDVKVMYTKPVA